MGWGWGSGDNLARIDAEGARLPRVFQSRQHHRYERLGFAVCGEFALLVDGLSVTQMWRDPAEGLSR